MLCFNETEMVTTRSIDELASLLSSQVHEDNVRYIGVDGKDDSGKSTLAKQLSKQLKIGSICLDDFVEKKEGGYVAFLDVVAINNEVKGKGCPLIIEGVCLLAAAERIGIELDVLIYVKRMSSYGYWHDEVECDPSILPDDLVLKLEEDLKKFSEFEAVLSAAKRENVEEEVHLPELVKEMVFYHAKFRPATKANQVYERLEAYQRRGADVGVAGAPLLSSLQPLCVQTLWVGIA